MNIYGGTGGSGGGAGTAGHGGGGGVGEGPRFNYDINGGAFTVNLVVQGQEREISGATRNPRRQLRTMSTPYGLPTPPRLTLTQSAGLHPSSSEQPIVASDTSLSSFRTRTASSIALPSFQLLFPDSEFPSLAGNRTSHTSSSNLHPLRLALPDTQFTPPAASDGRGHSPSALGRAGSSGSEPSVAAPGRPSYFEPALGHSGTSITFNQRQGEAGIYMLHRTAVLEALFDAAERFDQPRCHPETRTELLDELYAWAIDPDSAHPIRWLHGPAGAGKSAVMQSLCQRFQDAGRLGGSFFFKRGHAACGNARALFATLAYQLALSRCEVKSPISSSVEMDPSVLGRGMDVQMRALILEPCRLLEGRIPSILLIDGLDECDGHHIQQQILRLIRPAIRWPLRILVASRPEPHIRETFEDTSFQGLLESTNIERSFHDVRQYLLQEFSRIHREHHNTMSGVPTPWPSADILEQLVEKSSGYFIYASTVIKYVGNEYSRPTKRLDIICNLAPQDSESPFATLDQLYFQILSEVPSHSRRVLCDILSVIVNAPGSGLDEPEIDELLGLESGDTDLILRPLHSVLSMSSGSMKMVRVHHASFADFLVNEERSAIFHIGSPEHHFKLAYSILKALAFSYEHGDASFHWVMINGVRSWISYVSGVAPSTDLVPLVERVNPEFILCFGARDGDEMKTFLRWLKKISPPPEHLIDRWEALAFIGLYERFENTVMLDVIGKHPLRSLIQPVSAPSPNMIHTLHARMNDPCKSMLQAFCALLSQSPTLVRVLQARRLLFLNRTDDDYDRNSLTFFAVRGLLDISWDDMLRSIWSLRPFVTGESRNFPLLFLLHPALCQLADGLCDEAIVARDIGCGFLRMLKRSHNGEVPTGNMVRRLSYIYGLFNFYRESPEDGSYYQWGQHIRSSPSADPEILQELHDFSPLLSVGLYRNSSSEDIHDVLQWLKKSPAGQSDLIHRWQGYLNKSLDRDGEIYNHDDLEHRWQKRLGGEACVCGPEDEEEVIRCWEDCLGRYMDIEGDEE